MDADRRHFVLRRLHSLSGVFPIGVFLLEHFYTNSYSIKGPELFNEKVMALNNLPYLYVIEIGFIGLPILFHAVLGLLISFERQRSPGSLGYSRTWFYAFQRYTGMFLVLYIGVHVYLTRFSGTPPDQLFEHMASYLSHPGMMAFYVLGVLAASFHFGNGLWGFLIHWGITVTPRAQRVSSWVCLGTASALGFAGINSLFGFLHTPIGFLNR
jgi:succinate dehydrogenase / fumarate reductase cytochrome b subunit